MLHSGLLGEMVLRRQEFPKLDQFLRPFEKSDFLQLPNRKKSDALNRALLEWIQEQPEPCFLLAPVLEFIQQVEEKKLLEHYRFNSFEQWLNQFSGLDFEQNRKVRGKIVGKHLDRSEYQAFFPIGMGKVYSGTHFVTAHRSPDLDTTVASFWGWVDAFGARVGDGMHVWNVPGGPPESQIEIQWIFQDLFGAPVFSHLAKKRTTLNLTGTDLMTQKGMSCKSFVHSLSEAEHETDSHAVVLIDQEGFYLGDWRSGDVEGVRQVIWLLSSTLRWFENELHVGLIRLFAKEHVSLKEIEPFLKKLFEMEISHSEPGKEFTKKQRNLVHSFVENVLGLKKGLASTFEEFGVHLSKIGEVHFESVSQITTSMKKQGLFDSSGKLTENRPTIFSYLENTVKNLHEGVMKIRRRLERLDIALKTKFAVFGHRLNFVSVRSDVEEIRSKMGSYPYLTVNYPDQNRLYPVGVVLASEIRKPYLGTVSLRDFCNRDEMGIPPYLDVISVIDHHKSTLSTSAPPFAIISDAQSSNTLVAKQAFEINDRNSISGMTPESIEKQLQVLQKEHTPLSTRLAHRLMQKRRTLQHKGSFFVHSEREFIEYLHFLYAILDDTDLLSKVSAMDVDCVVELLNRLKTIATGKECEVLSLEDLPRDAKFPKKAAARILQNEEMYSLYRKVYAHREKDIEKNLHLAADGAKSHIFADTKEQNGCCRVGQTKLFAPNVPFFEKKADAIRKQWVQTALEVFKERSEIDLHMHLISTIVSAEEVYRGTPGNYAHPDELWIWIPSEETAVEHLKRFLTSFQNSPGLKDNPMEVEFLGENAEELALIFKESFLSIPQKRSKRGIPIAILRYKAGSLNSRKAMISPFLPCLS